MLSTPPPPSLLQAYFTGQGPIENLIAHLSDPGHNTIFTPHL